MRIEKKNSILEWSAFRDTHSSIVAWSWTHLCGFDPARMKFIVTVSIMVWNCPKIGHKMSSTLKMDGIMFSFCWEIDKKKQITEENLPIYLNTNKLCMFSAFIFINASCSWIWLLIEMSSVTWNSNDARQMEWRQNHRHHYQLLVLNWQRDTDRHHERDTWKWAYVCMQRRCRCIGIGEIESHHTLLHHQTP